MPHKLVKFTKMHGLGNDVVIINGISQSFSIDKLPIKSLAHRHTGIGFDQLLILMPSSSSADFACRIFNADGTEAEHCGNGMRCLARFIQEEKLSTKKSLTIELKTHRVNVETLNKNSFKIAMGIPQFAPDHTIAWDNKKLTLSILSLGNPHAIVDMTSLEALPFAEWGFKISTDPYFPRGVNVGFMEILSPGQIVLRTFERGAGPTLACGSNSCAAVAVGIRKKLLNSKVQVDLPLGNLVVEWKDASSSIEMIGPAEKVYEGTFVCTD